MGEVTNNSRHRSPRDEMQFSRRLSAPWRSRRGGSSRARGQSRLERQYHGMSQDCHEPAKNHAS
jgi:hypothetical protein